MKRKLIIGGIVLIIIATAVFLWYQNRKKKVETPSNILAFIKEKYGRAIAENVEKIYRLETNNFSSDQYNETFSAGQEANTPSYPYGWNTSFWDKNPQMVPIGLVSMRDYGGKTVNFIKYKNLEDAMLYLADFLSRYNNNAGRWFSTNEVAQKTYNDRLGKITPLLTNSVA